MDELKRQTFDYIYKLLFKNDLIVINDKTHEKKEKAFQSFKCAPGSSTCLSSDEHINSIFDGILLTVDADSTMKKNFKKIYDQIVNQLNSLRLAIEAQSVKMTNQRKQINYLQGQITALPSNMLLNEMKINEYEAVRLFQCYFLSVIIKKLNYRSWSHLTGM